MQFRLLTGNYEIVNSAIISKIHTQLIVEMHWFLKDFGWILLPLALRCPQSMLKELAVTYYQKLKGSQQSRFPLVCSPAFYIAAHLANFNHCKRVKKKKTNKPNLVVQLGKW